MLKAKLKKSYSIQYNSFFQATILPERKAIYLSIVDAAVQVNIFCESICIHICISDNFMTMKQDRLIKFDNICLKMNECLHVLRSKLWSWCLTKTLKNPN